MFFIAAVVALVIAGVAGVRAEQLEDLRSDARHQLEFTEARRYQSRIGWWGTVSALTMGAAFVLLVVGLALLIFD